jgi:hypothetical protein
MYQEPDSSLEDEMLVMPMVTALCAAGIAFYVRFLVALCKECMPRRIGFWVRLQLGSGDAAIAQRLDHRAPAKRAA